MIRPLDGRPGTLARYWIVAVLLGALGTLPARAEEPEPFRVATVYTVKEQGGGLGVFVDQIVVFQRVSYRDDKLWVVERRRHDQRMGDRTYQHQWIDGRSCPPLTDALAQIGTLPPSRFSGPADNANGWVSDTPYVTLTGPASGGRSGAMLMLRDLGGDLSRWWRQTEKILASCWQDNMVLVGDATVLPKLDTDEAAVQAGRP
jgi:hypothetical protein